MECLFSFRNGGDFSDLEAGVISKVFSRNRIVDYGCFWPDFLRFGIL